MQLAGDANRRRGGRIGSGSTRRPSTRRISPAIGLAHGTAVLDALQRHDYARVGSPVFIQSFEPRNLRQLRGMTRLPLVQLLEHELG